MLDDDDTPPSPAPAPLAVGWDDEDVAMLREMAQLTMDQARSLAADARAHAAALETGEAEPMTAAERGQLSLAMARAARSLRLTLALKAVARGAAGLTPSRTQVVIEPPDDSSDLADLDDPTSESAQCAAEMRLSLEYAFTDPAHDAAEVERLREGLEAGIEREAERERLRDGFDPHAVEKIARGLGLKGAWGTLMEPDGVTWAAWILGRPGDSTDPVISPLNWGDFLSRWRKPAPGALASATCHGRGKVVPEDWPSYARGPPDDE